MSNNSFTQVDIQSDLRVKIAFFVQPRLDGFLKPVVERLSQIYVTRLIITSNVKDVAEGMDWGDICWFEWCDSLVVYASKLPLAMHKKLICRLHSYEAFSPYTRQVNWNVIDKVIFVGQHIRRYVLGTTPQLCESQTHVIPNGVRLDRYTYCDRKPGFNIAYVGYINYKKGPMLLLHAFKAIHDKDPHYQLHIAGAYQDIRYQLYFEQMVGEWNLGESVHFDGWQNDVNGYLEDKNYVMSTSPLESQHMSVMEAMAKGIKPLIHNFYGAKQVYMDSLVWNSINDVVEMVTSADYSSASYLKFIKERYEFNSQMEKLTHVIDLLAQSIVRVRFHSEPPKVTVGIVNFTYSQYWDTCIRSVLSQTYPNIEILVVADCSTDDSQRKIGTYVESHSNVRAILNAGHTRTEPAEIREIFQNATGAYLLWINADNFLPHNDVITDYIDCFLSDDALDYVYGDLNLVNHLGHIKNSWTYREYTQEEVVRNIFQRKGSGVIPMAGMYKLSFYRANRFEWVVDAHNPNAGDTLNCLVNFKRGWNCRYLKKPTLAHRIDGNDVRFDVQKRIVSLISVMEYIVHNFDAAIYLPHLSWDALTEAQKAAQKLYAIGKAYLDIYQDYVCTSRVRRLDEQARKQCLQPLLDEVRRYFDQSLAASPTFESEIAELYKGTIPK